jgi:hypothetical protein
MLHTIIGAISASNERADCGIVLATRGTVAGSFRVTGGIVLSLAGSFRVMGGVVLSLASSCRVMGGVVLRLTSSCSLRVTGSVALRLASNAFFAPGLLEVGGCEGASELYTVKNNALG